MFATIPFQPGRVSRLGTMALGIGSLGIPPARFPANIATDADLAVAVNRLQTRLAYPLDNAALTMRVTDPTGIAANVLLSIDAEIVQTSGVPTGDTVPIIRGFDGTTAAAHGASALVSGFIDAYHHNTLVAEVEAIEQVLGGIGIAQKPESYSFTRTPGGNLIVGLNTITLATVPAGVNGTNASHYLYISGGTGTAEAVLIEGGTAVAGAPSGTVFVRCVYAHSGAWTIGTATGGMQEAIYSIGPGGGFAVQQPVNVYATTTIPFDFSISGQGPEPTIFAHGVAGQTLNIFQAIGTPGVAQTVTVSINADPTVSVSPTVTVADSSGFSPGDYIFMGGAANDFTNAYAQTSVVLTSSAGVITPREKVAIRIQTTDATKSVTKFVPVQNVVIDGLTLDGTGAATATTARGVFFSYVANVSARNCRFVNFTTGTGAAGFYVLVGYNVTASNLEFHNSGNANESDFMMTYASFSHANNIRSFFANGFGPQFQTGVGLVVEGVTSISAHDRGMKLAGVGRSSFQGIHVTTPRTASEGVCLALAWRTWSTDISGVEFVGASAVYGALWVQDAQSITVRGIHIVGSAGSGIQFEAGGSGSLGAVNVTVSELVTADPITDNSPASAGNVIKWATPYRTYGYSSLATIVSAASGAWTTIPFDQNAYDMGIHSGTVNNSRFTAPVRATYKIHAVVFFNGLGAGAIRAARIWFNGAAQLTYMQGAITGTYTILDLTATIPFVKGDYFELQVLQDSGAPLAVLGSSPQFTIVTVEVVQ